MKLYLVRHATATEIFSSSVKEDAARPLVQEGRKEAENVATALRHLGVKGDAFLASPLVRARQTAEIFAEVLGKKENLHICQALAPVGSLSNVYRQIAEQKRAEEIFLFGHMPDMMLIARALLHSNDLEIPFKKAGVCRIDVYDMPPTQPGLLKWFITPKLAQALQKT
jgi:phosphohistidine phosphatase